MYKSSNPVFNSQQYQAPRYEDLATQPHGTLDDASATPGVMTVRGTAMKTLYLLGLTILTAALSWGWIAEQLATNGRGFMIGLFVGSLVLSMAMGVIIMKFPKAAIFTVPAFAVAEGIVVAAITMVVVTFVPGGLAADGSLTAAGGAVVSQAAGGTLAIAVAAMAGVGTGILRLGNKTKAVVGVLVAGVAIYYMVSIGANLLLGAGTIPRIDMVMSPAAGNIFWIGLGFSALVVVLASFVLVMDMQFVKEGAERRLPKHYEWLGAFGLLTTLVWLYIELLKLIIKLQALMGRE